MYIAHTRHSGLARSLKSVVDGALRVVWNRPTRRPADWNRDILLAPTLRTPRNAPQQYGDLLDFFRKNKLGQWRILDEYFDTPQLGEPPYVVRPLRHFGGAGFEIATTLPPPERAATHYWRSLWKRNREYRVIFVHGKPVINLLKRVPEGTSQELAWNHGVSSFVTVRDQANDRLKNTTFFADAEAFFEDFPFHLLAVDVLYRKGTYAVVEVNFAPRIDLPANLDLVKNALLQGRSTDRFSFRRQAPAVLPAEGNP